MLRNWSGSHIMMAHVSFLRAVQHHEVGTIQRLIDDGADIDGVRETGLYAPLILAIRCGRVAVARLLLERGADPNRANVDSIQPLIIACQRRACAMATLLLDFGADIEATDDRGRTPLIRACSRIELATTSNVDLVTLLLDRGANILKGGPRTPLWHAVCTGKVEVTRLLLQHGAPADIGFDPSRPRRTGVIDGWRMDTAFVTPLYHRLRKDGRLETLPIARLLLAHGASFDQEHRKFDFTRPRGFYHVDTPLSLVRSFRTLRGGIMRELNELFDAYLQHYWRLRVRLRLFGSLSEHLLDLHVAPFLIGDGILSKKRS